MINLMKIRFCKCQMPILTHYKYKMCFYNVELKFDEGSEKDVKM